jgi:hypothetical protein
MKRYFLFIIGSFLILEMASMSMAASKLEKDMVAFDKVYVAALSLSGDDNRTMTKKVMKSLEQQWQTFKKNHFPDFNDDQSAKIDFAEISQMIDDAARIARLNGKLSEVQEILEGVRINFLHLRQRNSIDYYLDYLTKFHESMEPMVAQAQGKTQETLTSGNVSTMKIQFSECSQDWQEALKAKFDNSLFSFTEDMEAKRKGYLSSGTEALDRLRQALESENKIAIIQEAEAVRANFAQLFALFGSLEGVK